MGVCNGSDTSKCRAVCPHSCDVFSRRTDGDVTWQLLHLKRHIPNDELDTGKSYAEHDCAPDDLGISVQVQSIGIMSHLRSRGIAGPFLVVAPQSNLSDWMAEMERWCPSMPVLQYEGDHGQRQQLRAAHMPTGDDCFPCKSRVPM